MDVKGINVAACRYCISYGSNEFWCVLLLCSSCGGVRDELSKEAIEVFHNPYLLYLGPWVNYLFCV